MAAILRRTTTKAAAELLLRPARCAGRLARFLGDGAAAAASHGSELGLTIFLLYLCDVCSVTLLCWLASSWMA
jgi:hypothetical protein